MKKTITFIYISVFFLLCSFVFAAANNSYAQSETVRNKEQFDLTLPCQDDTSTIDYKQYYTDPEISGEITYVIFKAKMENEGDDVWALALFHGFRYAYKATTKGEKLAVGILFTNETGKIYYIERTVYTEFLNGNISNDEFVRRIQIEEVE
ncbi:MAG: hypothetical protein JW822_00440 [Spirochaetales bacterium]|nr:hypothetical protein [Spirochaetales bacterium]